MNTISLLKRFLLAATIVFFASCDTDYTEIGANVVDGDLHSNTIKFSGGIITAYDRPTGIVQTNGLDVNALGVYDNPVFGKTTAHYVTQVGLASANINPTLYSPVIDSVWIYIPYYSKVVTAATTDALATYKLDSIYGNMANSFKLDIRRNGYFLRDSDPSTGGAQVQKYYSNDKPLIDQYSDRTLRAEGQPMDFTYSPLAIKRTAQYIKEGVAEPIDVTAETLAPGMFINLDIAFFQDLLFNPANRGNLLNNSVFKEYFRGIYFKVTQDNGNIIGLPRFKEGVINIKYHDQLSATVTTSTAKSMTLSLAGTGVNLFDNTPNTEFTSAVAASDPVAGDSRLYLKGGEGSMAFLDIDTLSLAELKPDTAGNKRALINEANLVFYVDDNATNGMGKLGADGKKAKQPLRIYLYDVKNKRPLVDYYTDATVNTVYPIKARYIHGGLLDTVSSLGTRYKIRITDHINNLINKDSTNVKLGLVVTQSIANVNNNALKSPWDEPWAGGVPPVISVNVATVPTSSVMNLFGTVLYGTNLPADDPKRLKLEIFYTKPE